MSTFRQALDDNPAPQRLGDTGFTFDQRILMGETRPVGGGVYATGAGIAAVSFALAAAALLVTTQAATWLAAVLAADSALCAWLARRLERRSRHRRRFVVHFAAEQLRLERPFAGGFRLDARWVPFDDIRRVEVHTSPTDARLLVGFSDPGGEEEAVLIDDVPDDELEALDRFRKVIGAAFGLSLET